MQSAGGALQRRLRTACSGAGHDPFVLDWDRVPKPCQARTNVLTDSCRSVESQRESDGPACFSTVVLPLAYDTKGQS